MRFFGTDVNACSSHIWFRLVPNFLFFNNLIYYKTVIVMSDRRSDQLPFVLPPFKRTRTNLHDSNSLMRSFNNPDSVWYYFDHDKPNEDAECLMCEKVIRCKYGSTSGMRKHLESRHGIKLVSRKKKSQGTNKNMKMIFFLTKVLVIVGLFYNQKITRNQTKLQTLLV